MDIKKYNIIFTEMAKQDLKEIYNYKTEERVQDLNAGGVLYLH